MSALTLRRVAISRSASWLCPDCLGARVVFQRHLSSFQRRSEEVRRPIGRPTDLKSSIEQIETGDDPLTSSTPSLPSKTHQRRWQISKRVARLMDEILARASIAGQHINIYTGTDYSGIETLRKEIDVQERRVRDFHVDIDAARAAHHEAHAKQAASQKEIVGLLERKSSWSPEDLERYMSLVRSEHTDDQAVQSAKDGLNMTERDLENARAELERLERKQYHEEQIWSDTIRRNSTWVTFGLMGVNIVLLLAQITIFEPYRRRKIVKDVNQALNEKAVVAGLVQVEKQIDEVVEPMGVPLEAVQSTSKSQQTLDVPLSTAQDPRKGDRTQSELLSEEAASSFNPAVPTAREAWSPSTWSGRWEHYTERLHDLLSERVIRVKKVEMTTIALQGAATGAATIGLLLVLWRSK